MSRLYMEKSYNIIHNITLRYMHKDAHYALLFMAFPTIEKKIPDLNTKQYDKLVRTMANGDYILYHIL